MRPRGRWWRAGGTFGALVLLTLVPPGCSQPPAASCAPFDYSTYQARSRPSFKRDIQPALAISCALSTTCHGVDRGFGPQNHPLLGPRASVPADDAMLAAMMADLLLPSDRAPAVARVKPGRPQESFLVHKLDGSQSCAGVVCPNGCGNRMPQGGDPLPPALIDTIRDWILDGAQNN
jgi:hypothetical protein